MVVIKADLFQTEVLQCRGADRIFETDSIKTFNCKLNLDGFRKICPSGHSVGKKCQKEEQKLRAQDQDTYCILASCLDVLCFPKVTCKPRLLRQPWTVRTHCCCSSFAFNLPSA